MKKSNGKSYKVTTISIIPRIFSYLLIGTLLFGCSHQSINNVAEKSSPSSSLLAGETSGLDDEPIEYQTQTPADSQTSKSDQTEAMFDVLSQKSLSIDLTPIEAPATEKTESGNAESPEPLTSTHAVQQQLDEALDFCETAQECWQKGELERALDALDKAYSLILTVDPDDPANMVQQKEDIRFLISKRILEIYASRHIVVNGNHNAIPREMNRNIQKEIDLFTKGPERNFFIASYKRSGKYRPMILDKLEKAGLPAELSWLPLIESGFKVKALSHARALGLWQFIPSTGYKFGLKRNQYVDERIDFEKSTDAAIAYLSELHKIFGDWSTVLAAYNCGEGRVLRVIRTQNINYLDDFWDLYGRLPFETARYVPRFLAALHIIEEQEKYGMSEVVVDQPLAFETVDIHRQVHLKDLASPLGTSPDTLKRLNPELRYQLLPPETYTIRVPVGKKDLLLASIDQVPLSAPPRNEFVYHRVKRGETLSTIAKRYHSSVKKIMWANNLKRSSYIVAGKKLKVPLRGTVVTPIRTTSVSGKQWHGKHVVKSGDSLWIIAKRYNTTTGNIQEMNGLKTSRLMINQVLKVPSHKSVIQDLAMVSGSYHVRTGDSPYVIARKHGMSLDHFLKINNLTSRSTIYPGQSVKIE